MLELNSLFDEKYYLLQNLDVAIAFSQTELRPPTTLFEPNLHLDVDSDIDTAVAKNQAFSLVVVDSGIGYISNLLASLPNDLAVYILEADRNGISQITELLSHYHQPNSQINLYIIGHGYPGCITLGNADLSLETLENYTSDWAVWRRSVSAIALYSCQVAAGDAGEEFLQKLHRLTGANVSAATQLVGNGALGGTWNLDRAIGTPLALPGDLTKLAAYPSVLSDPNPAFDLIKLTDLRKDPRFTDINGEGVTVAVIDTGVDNTHPLLSPNFKIGQDFVNGTYRGDTGTHGTHVAGTVGATDSNIGVAPKAGLIGLQVFQAQGGAQNTDTNKALQWVLANHERYNIKVVNMSLGGGVYTSPIETDVYYQTIKKLEQTGVTVVSAAGNDYAEIAREKPREQWGVGSPGIISSLLVGSVWRDDKGGGYSFGNKDPKGGEQSTAPDRLSVFSQRLQAPNMIFAPGSAIFSTLPLKQGENNSQGFMSGTSMASPTVSGAVALLQQVAFEKAGRWYSVPEIVNLVRSTADTINDGNSDSWYYRNGERTEERVPSTNENYLRLNVLKAADAIVQKATNLGGATKDANGTLEGAYLGPQLDGVTTPSPIKGSIGVDGKAIEVGATDVDLYRFEVLSPGNLTIDATADPSGGNFNSELRLFKADGSILTPNNSDGSQSSPTANFNNVAPGIYYAGVSGANNSKYNPAAAGSGTAGATGNYQIQFSLKSLDANGLIAGATAENLTPGTPININEVIGTDGGTPVLGVDDVDFYRVVIPDNGNISVNINALGGNFNPIVKVFDENGTPKFSPITPLQGLSLNTFKGRIYYLGVSRDTNNAYNPTSLNGRPAPGTNGSYGLSLNFVSQNPNNTSQTASTQSVASDITDPNGSLSLAQGLPAITLPVLNQAGTIGTDIDPTTNTEQAVGDDDVDFTRINSPTAGVLDLQVTSLADPSNPDPLESEILVFDSNGELLATSADSPIGVGEPTRDPRLLLRIAANTDYFVAVIGEGTEDFDPELMGSGSSGDTGRYVFNAKMLSEAEAAAFSNDTISDSGVQAIELGEVEFGFIGEDGDLIVGEDDVDLYRFVSNITGNVNIRTTTYEADDADTVLRVFDASGNEIAFNDDKDDTTTSSLVTIPVSLGQTYYIGVNGYSPEARGYNPVTGSGKAAGDYGGYDLEISPETSRLPELDFGTVFNPTFYQQQNPDVAAAVQSGVFRTPLEHFSKFGFAEGRSPSAEFASDYLSKNQDVAVAVTQGIFKSGFEHFIKNGFAEGRDPSSRLADFDTFYLAQNLDVAQAVKQGFFKNGLEHLILFGMLEGRDPMSRYSFFAETFDSNYYSANSPDVAQAVQQGLFRNSFEHFVNLGMFEGRNPSVLFNNSYYLGQNSDVATAVTQGFFKSGFEHFIKFGLTEGRVGAVILGSDSADRLEGNAGANIIDGLAGDDIIIGGQGNDFLIGGADEDLFVLAAATGVDTIVDFQVDQDLLGLSGGLSFEQLAIAQGTGNSAQDTFVRIAANQELLAILSNLPANSITDTAFTLV